MDLVLNTTPRKTRGGKTSLEVYGKKSIAFVALIQRFPQYVFSSLYN